MKRIILYSILIFVFSCFIGYFYSKLWKNNNEIKELAEYNNVNENLSTKETAYVEEKITYDTKLAVKTHYSECGHTILSYKKLPSSLINLSKVELELKFPNYEIEEFSEESVILLQEKDSICNEHYVLKIEDNNVDVFHVEESGEEVLYKTTNIVADYLTTQDLINLEEGIYVYGKENINSAIEDFE